MREDAIQRLRDFPLDRLYGDETNPDCLFIDLLAQALGVEGTEHVTCYIHDEPTATYDDIIGRLVQLLKVPYEKPTTLSQLQAENNKLRELARYTIKCSAGEVDCQTCPFGEVSTRGKVTSCKVETAARELGVD